MAALQMFSAGLFKGPSSTSHIQSSGHLVRSEHNQIIEHIRVAPTHTSKGVFVLSAFLSPDVDVQWSYARHLLAERLVKGRLF